MKNIQIKLFTITVLLVLFSSSGCKKILKEEPRSIYTPDFFKTEKVFRVVLHRSMPIYATFLASLITITA